jgi:hypothetical protein
VGAFEDLHADRVVGSLAMFDRMIFKGYLTRLYPRENVRCFLWTQGVALKDFTPYAKWTTARIADTVRALAEAAGRPVISLIMSRLGTTPDVTTTWPSRSPSGMGSPRGSSV